MEGSSLSPLDGTANPDHVTPDWSATEPPFYSPSASFLDNNNNKNRDSGKKGKKDSKKAKMEVDDKDMDDEEEDGIFSRFFKWVSDSENDYDDELYEDSEYVDSSEEEVDELLPGEGK